MRRANKELQTGRKEAAKTFYSVEFVAPICVFDNFDPDN